MKRAHFAIGFMLFALLGANNSATASTNYFTEYFSGDYDLGGRSIMFEPTLGPDYYEITVTNAITELPAGLPTASVINFAYEWYPVPIAVPPGKTVKLYGAAYSTFYLSPNGYITFGSRSYTDYPSANNHFAIPHISAYFCDLDPTSATGGGKVTVTELWNGSGLAVTFEDVPRWNNPGIRCTFQCIMYYGGAIEMAWLHTSDPGTALVGLSRGDGIPPDYAETDLYDSGYVPPNPTDIDGDELPDLWEIDHFGHYTNCAPYGNGDSDDYDNMSEYVAGTDPKDSSSYFSVGCIKGSSQIVLNWNSLTGRTYSVQHTDSLTSPFTNLVNDITPTPPRNNYVTPLGSHNEGYFKAAVEMAP